MNIRYTGHSGFFIEFEQSAFLIDYYEGTMPLASSSKKYYVLVSHKHADHFNRAIFTLAQKHRNIIFIISSDAKMNQNFMESHAVPKEAWDKIQYVSPNQSYSFPECTIETLESTDQGVAFLITAEGKTVYHAGDLNWWTWKGETNEEYEDMTRRFQDEIKKLQGREIDAAFLPLDPRQEERFYMGFDYFMRNTNTKQAYPMHFWKDPSVLTKLLALECSEPYREKIVQKHFINMK